MKIKREIKINNIKLKSIRDQLRFLLHAVYSAYLNEILDEKRELKNINGFWDKNHLDYHILHKKIQELSSRENDLGFALDRSIIFCPTCQKFDKDMTYNPISKKWYCSECYVSNQKLELEKGKAELFP